MKIFLLLLLYVVAGRAQIVTILGTDQINNSRTVINDNFVWLRDNRAALSHVHIIADISGLGTGVGALLATPSSANLRAAITDETGTGVSVFADTPTLITPVLGVATATSVNKVAITAPATSATLTVANGKTLTANNTLTFAGTDATTMTFPAATGAVLTADSTATLTNKSITGAQITSAVATATALAADPADCATAGAAAHGVNASGTATGCIDLVATYQPLDADLTTLAGKTITGNGANIRLSSGAFTTDDIVKVDANGNLVSAGPGGGGGDVTATQLGIVIPTASTGAAIQTAIDALPSGGTVWLKGNTTYVLGTTGLTVAAGQNDLKIHFESGSSLTYAGTGTALTVGGYGAVTYRFSMTGEPFINLLTASGTSARGLLMNRMGNAEIHRLRVESETKGAACTGTAREAIKLDGGNVGTIWSGYQNFYTPHISGDFKYGFFVTAAFGHADGNNTNSIQNGFIANTCSDNPAGFIGIYLDLGDSTQITNPDLDGWTVGLQIEGHGNRVLSLRTENNNTDWIVGSGAVGNQINGGWLSHTDSGTNTTFRSGGNGTINSTQIITPTMIGDTKLTGTLGFSASATAAADAFLTRLGATTMMFTGEFLFRSGFGAPSLRTDVAGDSFNRWYITGGGMQSWSSGAATYDTTLLRQSPGLLRIATGDGSTRAGLEVATLRGTGSVHGGTGAAVASATTTALGLGDVFHITGTATITTMNTCDATNSGRRVTLIFDAGSTLTDGGNLRLASTFTATADDTITLVCDATNWFEASRSVN
jgi:hypothetical protein